MRHRTPPCALCRSARSRVSIPFVFAAGADANVTIAAPVGQPAVLLRTDAFSDVGQQFVANLVKEGVLPAVEAQ